MNKSLFVGGPPSEVLQRISLNVYGFGPKRSIFLIVVFPIKKLCIGVLVKAISTIVTSLR